MRIKIFLIEILTVAIFVGGVSGFSGCRTVKYSEMSPPGTLPQLLPPLEAEIDVWSLESVFGATITRGSVSDFGFYEGVTYMNPVLRDVITLYERDMRNIAKEYGPVRGKAVCRLVDGDFAIGGYGWVALSGGTFLVLNLVGMPFAILKGSMQLEMSIYDVHGVLVGRYTSENHKKQVPLALYFGYGNDAQLKVAIDTFKACMTDIKGQIELDFNRLNGVLVVPNATDPMLSPNAVGAPREPALREVW